MEIRKAAFRAAFVVVLLAFALGKASGPPIPSSYSTILVPAFTFVLVFMAALPS